MTGEEKLPAGRPPWDTWNGARVGLLAGGVVGILAVWLVGSDDFWLALIVAAVGGAVGFWSEWRKRS